MIKAVVFDAGGVLILEPDSKDRLKLYQEFHKEPDYSLLNIGKITLGEMLKRVAKRGTLSDQELIRLKNFILKDRSFNKVLHRYGLSLKKRGLKIGICSNNSRTVFDTWNRTFHFTHGYEPYVRVSARVGLIKPEKRIFLMMSRLLGVKPSEMIFVDDRADNVRGAIAAGVKAIRFTSNRDVIRKIEKLLK